MATVTNDGSGYFLYHSIGMFPGKDERIAEALARVATIWGTPNDAQWPLSLEIRTLAPEVSMALVCRLASVERALSGRSVRLPVARDPPVIVRGAP